MLSLQTKARPIQPIHRFAGALLAVFATLFTAISSLADDTLLPDDALLTVNVAPLSTLYDSSLVQQVTERLNTSRMVQEALQTVEAQNLQDAITFLEQQLGRPATEMYSSLTAGGVEVAVGVEGKPWLLIVAHAADEQITADVVKLAVDLAKSDGTDVPSGEHRGYTGYQVGNTMIAAVGSRLLIGTSADLLKATVDRILDGSPASRVDVAGAPFQISAQLDLERFRAIPDVAKGLKLPASNGGTIASLGGWIDLLLREQSVQFDLKIADDGIETVVRFAGAGSASSPPFAGFWADEPDEQPAPLLVLPGTIYSTTWYRDYGALWQAREQLVTQDVVKELERADAEAAAQFETLGSAVSLSDVAQQLGPRLRIVVAEQIVPPYGIELRNPLPAAAVVVELKDEAAFHEIADPLARVVHLILSFDQKITSEPLEHGGAALFQLSQPHTPDDVRKRDLSVYNYRPTHTITRGHFILGSTPEIVRQTIDALDAQAAEQAPSIESGVTSQQVVDIHQFAAALERARDAAVRQSVLTTGVDVDTANHEFDVLLSILELFDTKTITGIFTEDGFESRVAVGVREQKSGVRVQKTELSTQH